MTHDEMIVQSKAGKLAEKFLDENYPEDASDWLVIELAHYFLDFVEMELQEQRERCADAVIAELKSIGFQIYESGEARIRDACLSATEEDL